MKGNLSTVGRPRWSKIVGGVAGELLKSFTINPHFINVHVARAIGIESEPLAIGTQSYYLDALGGGHDRMRRRDRHWSRSGERHRPDADVGRPSGIRNPTFPARGDAVNLETGS